MIVKVKALFIFLLFITLMISMNAHAQKKSEIRDLIMGGNEYYFKEQFAKALEFYYQVVSMDSLNPYANFYLAECHRKIFNFKAAEGYYKIVAAHARSEFPLSVFYFPLMQKLNGKFQEAIVNFNDFISYAKEHDFAEKEEFLKKAKIEREGCYFAISHLENPFGEYDLKNLGEAINTTFNDYAPFIFGNDSSILLTSGRSTATGGVLNNRYGEYFSDIFRFQKDTADWISIPNDDNFQVNNTSLAEGAGSYAAGDSAFYYTGCYEDGSFCKIYVSRKKNGKWQAPQVLSSPINLKGFDNKQPAITAGGDTLFFVSDRPHGFGENDIWMSIRDEEGNWGKPVNMGEKVNTAYNEISPFYYKIDNILFFASDGHEGLGGLDVFMAKGGIGTFSHVENLGFPFNSNHDDGFMVLGEKKGFLASNRQGGLGNFDIYQFNIITRQSIIAAFDKADNADERVLRSRVLDSNGAMVYVMREEDQFFYDNLKSEEKQTVLRIVAAKLKAFAVAETMQLTPEDFSFYNQFSPADKARLERMTQVLYAAGKNDLDQYLKTMPIREPTYTYLTISGRLFDTDTKSPAPHIEIPLVDEGGNMVKVTTTNEDGSFKYVKLPLNRKYRILAENTPKKLTESPRFYVKEIQLKEETKKPIIITFENIYFDVNKKTLRPEAKQVLDELIAFYNANPQIQIELYAYADTTGSDEYNLNLSNERGEAAYEYLIQGKVDRTALVIKAQGKDISGQAKNERINLQLNRRVEFNIVGAVLSYHSTTKTYILKQNTTLEKLAAATGNEVSELKVLNGTSENMLPAYTPVRIKVQDGLDVGDLLFEPSVK